MRTYRLIPDYLCTEEQKTLCPTVSPSKVPGVTKLELMPEGNWYDTALPQYWYDEFYGVIGKNPLCMFCWDTKKHVPVPLTEVAEVLLEVFEYASK
jgi:hypothetical protein